MEGFTIESLADNEAFVTAAIKATRIAIGIQKREKRDMLRHALHNIAVGKAPNEELQQVYLDAVKGHMDRPQ